MASSTSRREGDRKKPDPPQAPCLHSTFTPSSPLTPPQPDRLAVLLQLGNQLITLAHQLLVLLVLVVGAVRLDDAVAGDAVDGAGDAAGGDELGEVAGSTSLVSNLIIP
jgi:hypothetical protein